MKDVLRFGKKLFTTSVVVMTIAWSMGLAALVPAGVSAADVCSEWTVGTDYKVKGGSGSLYRYMGGNMVRPWFHESHWLTWDGKTSNVVQQPASCWDATTVGPTMPLRPGTLAKVPDLPKIYMVGPNGTWAPVASAEVLNAITGGKGLVGQSKGGLLFDLPGTLVSGYTQGAALTESKLQPGQLVKTAGSPTVWYVNASGQRQQVNGTLSANLSKQVSTVSDTVLNSAVAGSTSTTPTEVSNTSASGSMPQATGTVTVSVSPSTPGAGTYVAKGAYNAEFAKFTFTAVGGSAKVKKVVIKRDGLGFDADISAVRLYDGAKQLGSDQALNTTNHLATFSGLNWELSAGQSKTLTVTADTVSGLSGTNDYLVLNSAELESGTVSGAPASGNALQFHAVTVGVLDVDALTTPGASTLISGATAQEVAGFNLDTDSAEGFNVKALTFTNNGTINNDEVSNFVLKDGATVIGSNPGTFGSDGKVTIDMSAKPYFIDKSKSKNLTLSADIKAGITVSKTLIVQIAESKHVVAMGDSSKSQVVATNDNGSTFAAQSASTMTIGQGTLTVTRNTATLPVTGALIDGVAHNKVAAYRFSAGATEGQRVTRVRLTVSGTAVGSADFSNFALYKYDETTGTETQVGSSQSISGSNVTFEDTDAGLFDVAASKNVVLHVYADVNTAAAWTGTSFNVFIGSTNSNLIVKAKGMQSGEFVPATSITLTSVDSQHANVVLFSNSNSGSLTLSLDNTSPSATSIAKGTNDVNFAHYRLYAASEDITVSQLVVRAYNSSGTGSTASTTNEFVNVRLYDVTGATPVQLGTAVATPSSGVSTFSFSLVVPKDSYKVLRVVADVPTASAGLGVLHFDVPGAGTVSDDITSTGAYSGVDISESGSATGRTMTLSSPTLTVSWASGVTNNLVANSQAQTLGTLQLTAGQYEDVKVSSVKVSADDGTPIGQGDPASSADTDLTNFKLVGEDGTQYGVTKNLTSGSPDTVTFDGIANLVVTKGTTKNLYVQANVAGTSGTYYVGSTSTADVVATGAVSGNSATVSGTGVGRANTIQSVATLAFTLDASNPQTRLVGVGSDGTGEEVTLLALGADAQYEDVDVTKLVVQAIGASGDSVQNSFKDSGLKLYHKKNGTETLVGSATFVSSTDSGVGGAYTATFNMSAGTLRIMKTTDDVLVVKGVFKGTESGLTSGTSPVIRLGNGSNTDDSLYVEARGVSSGTSLDDAQFNSTNGLSLSSNQVVAYKTYPTVSYVDVGGTLVNGVEQNIFGFKVKASASGQVSLKQLKFSMDIVDNSSNGTSWDANMQAVSFKLFRGTDEITSVVRIADSRGKSLEGGSNAFATATGTGKAIYVTWETTNEEKIPAGSEYTYYLKATPSGFNTDADNDYIRVRFDNDDTATELTQANATYYVSPATGTAGAVEGGYLLSLQDSFFDGNTVASTSTTTFLWSDYSAANHSAATGTFRGGAASSTGDWFNGYYVKETPTNYSLLVR